VGGRGPSLGIE
jgi:hypothetical protein